MEKTNKKKIKKSELYARIEIYKDFWNMPFQEICDEDLAIYLEQILSDVKNHIEKQNS